MDKDIAIKVEGVYKDFRLPHQREDSIKRHLLNGLRRRSKGFVTQSALKDINFEVKKGEFFGILGRNGSGKSTLLKIISDIYQPTKGRVQRHGKLVAFIELGVGFNPELTGKENVYLNAALLGFSRKETDTMYDEIVEFSELADFMEQKLKNYSSGMTVRLAFSVAIRAKADILILDEVLAVGDAAFQRKCLEYFSEIKKRGTTVIFVSHSMESVMRFCDRALLIDDSVVIDEGDAQHVANHYTKMFIQEASAEKKANKTKGKTTDRLGDGAVLYVNRPVVDIAEKMIALECGIHVKHDIEQIVMGYSIKNQEGRILFGTNTRLLKVKLPDVMPKGYTAKVRWEFPNVFNEGEYSVTLAISYGAGNVADLWEDCGTIRILSDGNNPYLINPKSNFSLE